MGVELDSLRASAILTVVLVVKQLFTNLNLGGVKVKAGTRAPEDTYQQRPSDPDEQERLDASQKRAQGIVNNDLENIPTGLLIAWASQFCIFFGGDADVRGDQAVAHIVLFGIFVGCRIGHSICYSLAWSWMRTVMYVVALISELGMGANLIVAAFFAEVP
jgi:uncharacterized MAPEG superfamily protein